MKFENIAIHGLTVEIKAKGLYNTDRYNKEDTCAFINSLIIFAREASELNVHCGYFASAKEAREFADELHRQLADIGYYGGD